MKKVILISNYFHFAQEKESNRYRVLADMLSKEPDIELEVITSSFYQRTKEFRKNKGELAASVDYKVTFIDEPGYQKNISLKRLKTSRVFARNTLEYLKTQPTPDLIYQVVPTLDVADLVGKYANEHGIPFVIDIQDLWPEAFGMAFKVPVISRLLFSPFMRKANRVYGRADAVCAVSQTYVDRALRVNKKVETGHAVYIGINLASFDGNLKEKTAHDGVKLVYCGSLEKSYDIKTVIDALSMLADPPQFVVIGEGSLRGKFESYAKEKGVDAVFTGFLPYPEMCNLMCNCDITINPIIGSSVASIINKHGDYVASGLPVINTQMSKEYRALIDQYKMGFNCASGNARDVADKIKCLTENETLRKEMGRNARRCAEERFDRDVTYKELVSVVKELV